MPSNFRTYEAQSRLLAAVIAGHPGLKLNFKAITLHFGSDVTESVIRHRFRPVKMQAEAVRQAVAQGQDAKDLSGIFHLNEKEIAKYFGESTPQGIEFQFRAIRKDAKALRDAVDKGESPLTVRKSVPAANRRSTASASTSSATSLKRQTPPVVGAADGAPRPPKRTNTGTAASKRPRADLVFSNGEDSSSLGGDDVDYEQLDLTPMGTPTSKPRPLPTAFLPAGQPLSSLPATPITPTTAAAGAVGVASASSSFLPDLTPALSSGSTPLENSTPGTVHRRHQQRQAGESLFARSSAAGGNGCNVFSVDEDDEDDDGVFILDTPSKVPKIEAPAASAAAIMPSAGDFGSWHCFAHSSSNGNMADPFQSFDVGSSSWAQDDPFSSATSESFSHPVSQSFYENEGAI